MTGSLHDFWQFFHTALGLGKRAHELHSGEMALRALVMYGSALVLVRLGARRFMGKSSPFDLVLSIIVGSVMSRGITGQAPFFPTLVAGATLISVHFVLAAIAFRIDSFSSLIKGKPHVLIRDGELIKSAMRRHHIGQRDLQEALRTQGKLENFKEVHLAVLERSGQISVLPSKRPMRAVELGVEEGVKTIHLEIER